MNGMTRNVSALFLLALPLFLLGQNVQLEHLKGLTMRSVGPAGMSGRVTSIEVVEDRTEVIYVGTASGGLWRSTSGGTAWEPIFDEQPLQSVGALAINQDNPDELWVGTGEGNPRNSQNSGAGIFKSLDGGRSWTRMGLENTKTIHRILINRHDPRIVYVAALGSAWGPNPERGVFRTTDGGQSWEKVLYVNDSTGCADLVMDPRNPNKLVAAMWEYGRKPWTFRSGGAGSGIYVTYDGGKTWTERTHEDGLPKGDLGRIGLAIAASKPEVIYALVEAKKNALYKSTDGGHEWKKIADENIGNRPFYYADIFVDPKNENRLWNLHSQVSKSEDGGKTFEMVLPFEWFGGVHPDHHALYIHPENPDFILNGNDGGLNISRDGGKTWRFVSNLPLAQFYHINYDMDIPYHLAGGMQDNGTWVGPSNTWKRGGIRNSDWQEVYFGDGFDLVFDATDNRYLYAMSQGGNLAYVDRHTGKTQFIQPVHPEGVELRFNWNAGIAQDPHNPNGIYFGSQFLHYTTDHGQRWRLLSPDLTTNDTSKQKQYLSGGLTIDDTRAENFTSIIAIAPSPHNANVIWVGTDDGRLQLTRDRGQTWTDLAGKLPGARAGSWIPQIVVSPHQAGEAFVVVNDYRRNDWRPMVYHTSDFGATFRRIVDEEQVEGHALSIVQDHQEPNLLWLGTDYGLYVSFTKGADWQKWTNDFPSVSTRDLKIHPREGDLIVGTFGRSAYILDDLEPLREIARTKGQVLDREFCLFDAPDAYLAHLRSVDGARFIADGEFDGDKRPYGALLSLWVHPDLKKDKPEEDEEEESSKKKDRKTDKLQVAVLDMAGDTVRQFSTEIDTGMQRISWDLRRNGVRYPSRREAKPDADPPRGIEVLPGTYRIVAVLGDSKDSTSVRVHMDPRIEDVTLAGLKKRHETFTGFYDLVEKASTGFGQLQEAEQTIARVNTALETLPDSTQKEFKKLGKSLQDSINRLEELYMLPEDFKGIRRSTGKLNSTLSRTGGYLSDLEGPITQGAELMLAETRRQTEEVLEQIHRFMTTDWADYRRKVEALDFSLFKPYEAVRLE